MTKAKNCSNCAKYGQHFSHKDCGICSIEHYPDDTESAPSHWEAKPMTNADKIRAMDDETLASQLVKVFEEGVLALTDISIPYELLNEVRSEFLKKLKEPVEDK